MTTYKGKLPYNAETTIDYDKKQVSFNYPAKDPNMYVNYFGHSFYVLVGLFFSYFLVAILVSRHKVLFLDNKMWVIPLLGFIFFGWLLFAYFSLFLHIFSENARNSYPYTNAIWDNLRPHRTIDLTKKYSHIHYIHDNILFIPGYKISQFKYKYKGKNRIKKFYTKSVEKDGKKGDHMKFVAFFEFDKPITEGTLKYQ